MEEKYLLNVRCYGSFGVKVQSLDTLNVLFLLLTLKTEGVKREQKTFLRCLRVRWVGVNGRLEDRHCRHEAEVTLIYRFPGSRSCI